jgi:hypothetical protein
MSAPLSHSAGNPKSPEKEGLCQEGTEAYQACDYVTALAKWRSCLPFPRKPQGNGKPGGGRGDMHKPLIEDFAISALRWVLPKCFHTQSIYALC